MVLVRTASAGRFSRVPTIHVLSRNMKKYRNFYLKISSFSGEISIYLNRHVFVVCPHIFKRDCIFWLLVCFPTHYSPSKMGSIIQGKNLLPMLPPSPHPHKPYTSKLYPFRFNVRGTIVLTFFVFVFTFQKYEEYLQAPSWFISTSL